VRQIFERLDSKQVASLSVIVNEHLRPYVAEIFDIVDELWETRHLGTILTSVTMIAAGVPDDFRKFVPRLVRKLLSSLDDVQTSDWFKPSGRQGISDKASVEFDKLELILRSLKSLRGVLGDYLHVLVTSLLKLADALITASSSADTDEDNRAAFTRASIETLKTISHLLEHDSVRPSTEMPAASWA
jgi:FKBP12-rapamycin complex-associated protein